MVTEPDKKIFPDIDTVKPETKAGVEFGKVDAVVSSAAPAQAALAFEPVKLKAVTRDDLFQQARQEKQRAIDEGRKERRQGVHEGPQGKMADRSFSAAGHGIVPAKKTEGDKIIEKVNRELNASLPQQEEQPSLKPNAGAAKLEMEELPALPATLLRPDIDKVVADLRKRLDDLASVVASFDDEDYPSKDLEESAHPSLFTTATCTANEFRLIDELYSDVNPYGALRRWNHEEFIVNTNPGSSVSTLASNNIQHGNIYLSARPYSTNVYTGNIYATPRIIVGKADDMYTQIQLDPSAMSVYNVLAVQNDDVRGKLYARCGWVRFHA